MKLTTYLLRWIAVSLLLAWIAAPQVGSAQVIVLRDLSRVLNVAVKSLDDEALTLMDDRQYSWDQILQADVAPRWQKELNDRVTRIGLPLFRLKQRLRISDFKGAMEIAESVYRGDAAFVGCDANFLVCRSVMQGRIEAGQFAEAVEPMFRAVILQEQCRKETLDSFPHLLFEPNVLKAEVCEQLLPIWPDHDAAKTELARLAKSADVEAFVETHPAAAVYLATMAARTEQYELASRWSAALDSAELRPWRLLIKPDFAKTYYSQMVRDAVVPLRLVAMYQWATDPRSGESNSNRRVLELLKIVANYQKKFPQASRLSLQAAISISDDSAEREILQQEYDRIAAE